MGLPKALKLAEFKPALGLNPGGGSVQDKDKALLSEIIAKLNDLFTGDLTDEDKVTYVSGGDSGQVA